MAARPRAVYEQALVILGVSNKGMKDPSRAEARADGGRDAQSDCPYEILCHHRKLFPSKFRKRIGVGGRYGVFLGNRMKYRFPKDAETGEVNATVGFQIACHFEHLCCSDAIRAHDLGSRGGRVYQGGSMYNGINRPDSL